MMYTSDPSVLAWMRSMGYPLAGQPHEIVEAMFLREAQQWGLEPYQLRALIRRGQLRRQAGHPRRPVFTWKPLAARVPEESGSD